MRNANRWIGVIVGGVVLMAASYVLAGDWPQWRGPNRDGKVTGFTAPQTWPKTLAQKWKKPVGAGDASPALVGDRLYVFAREDDNEVTRCMNVADGNELWQNKFAAATIPGPDAREHAGPRSSPAVADGKVVTIGVWGNLGCIDAANGADLWRKDPYPKATPRFHAATSPLIVDGMVVAQLGGPGNGALMAFDLATGNVKWKWDAEGPGYASPVAATIGDVKQIVTLTEKSVVGVALADGKLLWQVAFAPQGMAYNAATPIVNGQTVIFTGQGRGTKAVKIEKSGDVFTPKELWSVSPAVQFSSPVLKDGLLFAVSATGNLFCVNAETGVPSWTDKAKLGRGGYGAMLDAGSVILALPDNSELVVFKPSDKQYEELARIKVADTPTYAYPVIAGQKLLVKDRDALTLWTIE